MKKYEYKPTNRSYSGKADIAHSPYEKVEGDLTNTLAIFPVFHKGEEERREAWEMAWLFANAYVRRTLLESCVIHHIDGTPKNRLNSGFYVSSLGNFKLPPHKRY